MRRASAGATAAEVGVAAQHQMRATHRALRGVHRDLGAVLIAQHPGVLENHRPGRLGRARHALRELERVQMAAARIDEPAEIALAAHVRLQFIAIQQLHRGVAVVFVQLAGPILQFRDMPRLDGDVHMIGVIVAVDAVLGDQRLREIQRLDGQIEQPARVVAADLGGERLLTRGQAENRLAAAAARGAVADDVRLQQSHTVAALRQMQCSRAAGNAAAEDHHVHAVLAAQRLALRPRAARGEGRRGGGGRERSTRRRVDRLGARRLQVFKILWLLTGLGACEPTGLFDRKAMLLHCTKRR